MTCVIVDWISFVSRRQSSVVPWSAVPLPSEDGGIWFYPQNVWTHFYLARVLTHARSYSEASTAFKDAQALNPGSHMIEAELMNHFLASGRIEQARQSCESPATPLNEDDRHYCLALAYHALERQADAEREFEHLRALDGDSWAHSYAGIYARWGNGAAALQWLRTAEQLHDPGLSWMKVDWELDPIRNDAQFKAIEARLKFPP
jgi:tetratricopeptide (TPR) repeat protein